jgi:hypothetical protein
MRDDSEDCASDAGKQLPLLDESGASRALRASGSRKKRRADAIATTQSGIPKPGPLGFFVIFLWLLSNEKKHPLDWPGVLFTLEEAARHHALIFEDEDT